MKTSRRIALSFAISLVALSAAANASAEPGTIVLNDGTSVAGEITEMVSGDHLSIRLPNGELRTLAWSQIATMQVGVSGTIFIGGQPTPTPAPPPPQPAPPPPVVYAPAPPPPVVYAPPPPQPAYGYPPPPPAYQPPPPRFQPAWVLGGRFGTLSPGKDSSLIGASQNGTGGDGVALKSFVGSGVALEADVGYHFSPSWTFYGFWEHGFLGKGDANSGVTGDSSSNFVGIGFKANTNPRGPLGFYFDVGAGYRWLSFSYANAPSQTGSSSNEGRLSVGGWEPLRLGIGAAIVVSPQFTLDVLLHASAGYFSKIDDSARPCSGSGDASCGTIPVDNRAIHTFSGISVAAHWDLL